MAMMSDVAYTSPVPLGIKPMLVLAVIPVIVTSSPSNRIVGVLIAPADVEVVSTVPLETSIVPALVQAFPVLPTRRAPPSPHVIVFTASKEKQPIWPNVPRAFPFIVPPVAWQAME